MKRVVSIFFLLLMIVTAIALVAPGFIDWNKHKNIIEKNIEAYLQKDIEIAGNVSFRILPQPEIIIEKISVLNDDKNKEKTLVSFKKVAGRLMLGPLLEGKVEVDSAEFIEPIINIEVVEKAPSSSKGISKAASAISLNKLIFVNASLNYKNHINGINFQLSDLDALLRADTLLGPYTAKGSLNYSGSKFDFDIKSKLYNKKSGSIPLTAYFEPDESGEMPEIDFKGIVALKDGFEAQGELSLNNGKPVALFKALKDIAFFNDRASFNTLINFSKNNLKLEFIEGKIGDKGELNGSAAITLSAIEDNFIDMQFSGKNLTISEGNIKIPKELSGKLKFQGRNILFGNKKIALLDPTSVFSEGNWQLKYTDMLLNDGSKLTLSGELLAAEKKAAYKVKLETKDFKKFSDNYIQPSKSNIISDLSESALFSSLEVTADVNLSANLIELYNINSTINNASKITGALSIARGKGKPIFGAKFNMYDFNTSAFSKDSKTKLIEAVMASDADVELTVKNLKGSDIKLKDVVFDAKIRDNKLKIKTFKGGVSSKEKFAISGKVASLKPISGLDIAYTMESIKPSSIAKLFGINMPPMFFSWNNSNINGHINGNSDKYNFSLNSTVKDNDISLKGNNVKGIYDIDINIKNKKSAEILNYIGLPISSIFSDKGGFSFKGKLKGNDKEYKITDISAMQGKSGFKGSLEKSGDAYKSAIETTAFDIDKFLSGNLSSKLNLALNIKGKTLWGGELNSEVYFNKKGKIEYLKGNIKDVDLNKLNLVEEKLSVDKGDVSFDLKPHNSKLKGFVGLTLSNLKLDNFSLSRIGKKLDDLKEVPDNTEKLVKRYLAINGDSEYKNIDIKADIDGNRFSFKDLILSNEYGDITISGQGDLKTKNYSLKSKVAITNPRRIPDFYIYRTSNKDNNYTIDVGSINKFIVVNNPAPLEVHEDIGTLPQAAEALPPVTEFKPEAEKAVEEGGEDTLLDSERNTNASTEPTDPTSAVIEGIIKNLDE